MGDVKYTDLYAMRSASMHMDRGRQEVNKARELIGKRDQVTSERTHTLREIIRTLIRADQHFTRARTYEQKE